MKLLLTTLVMTLALPAFANVTYKLDTGHSEVGFKVKHLVVSTVPGKFRDFEGQFKFDEKTGKVEDVVIKIKTASIDTNESKRDEHLRGKDFFEVEKYPTIEFKSTKTDTAGGKPNRITGDLTIHGVTKSVVLKVKYNGSVKDPWGNKKIGFEATTKVNREDYGLTWNKALEAGGVVVGKDVEITILGEATADAKTETPAAK